MLLCLIDGVSGAMARKYLSTNTCIKGGQGRWPLWITHIGLALWERGAKVRLNIGSRPSQG